MLNQKLLRNFLTYASGAVLARLLTAGVSLATIQIFTPAQFGLLALFNSCLVIVPAIFNLGLRQVFSLEFFHRPNSAARFRLLNELLALYLIVSLPSLIAGLLALDWLNYYLFLHQATKPTIMLALCCCWLNFFSELFYQVLRYQQRARALTAIQLISAITTASLTLLLVFILQLQILGYLIAQLLGLSLVCIYAGYRYHRTLQCQSMWSSATTFPANTAAEPHRTTGNLAPTNLALTTGATSAAPTAPSHWQRIIMHIKQYLAQVTTTPSRQYYQHLKLGTPYLISIFCAWLLSTSNRWLLAYWSNLELVGIYALADSFGQLFNLAIANPLLQSYLPALLEKFRAQSADPAQLQLINRQNFKTMYWVLGGLALLILLGFGLGRPLLLYLAPPKYHTAFNYVLIILAGQLCLLGSYFATGYLQLQKRVYLQVGLTIAAALVNLLLNWLLIPRWQLYGCTTATLIAYALYFWATIKATHWALRKN